MGIPCTAAVDFGTTAVKVCLFTERLFLLSECVREYRFNTPKTGYAEAPASVYTEALADGLADVAHKAQDAEIIAVSLTTQGETFTVIDSTGKPIMPFIVWLDTRAVKQADKIRKLLPDNAFYSTTGLPAPDGALPLAKAMWLADNHPEAIKDGNRILLLEDYFLYLLSGSLVSEKSLQTSTGWFSLRDDKYWEDAIKLSGLKISMLPELAEPGETVGKVTKAASARFGLPEGIPVVAGAMDQTAAALAAGCTQKGVLSESTGTALAVTAYTDSLPDTQGSNLTIYRHIKKGDYLAIGIGRTGGKCLTWLRDLFFHGSEYDALVSRASLAPIGSNGLVFLPFLAGMDCDKPDSDLHGCFCGLTLSTAPEHVIRSVLEGICCELAALIDRVESVTSRCDNVISMGGGAKSALLNQMKADVCQKTFAVPCTENTAAAGAAMLAFNTFAPFPTQNRLELSAVFYPEPANLKASAQCLARYRRIADRFTHNY